jgi:hypothetical protein
MSSNSEESSVDSNLDEEEKEIYNTIHAEFDDLTSGYSTISSNKSDFPVAKKFPPIIFGLPNASRTGGNFGSGFGELTGGIKSGKTAAAV